jgi:hypothetical protein
MRNLDYHPEQPDALLDQLDTTVRALGTLKRVTVGPQGTVITNLNGEQCTIDGLTFGDPTLVAVLKRVGASFNPATVHNEPPNAARQKEFEITARYPWAKDRIL